MPKNPKRGFAVQQEVLGNDMIEILVFLNAVFPVILSVHSTALATQSEFNVGFPTTLYAGMVLQPRLIVSANLGFKRVNNMLES